VTGAATDLLLVAGQELRFLAASSLSAADAVTLGGVSGIAINDFAAGALSIFADSDASGGGTLTISNAVSSTMAGGSLSLRAAAFSLVATVNAGSAPISVEPSRTNVALELGPAVDLTGTEVNYLVTTAIVTFGGSSTESVCALFVCLCVGCGCVCVALVLIASVVCVRVGCVRRCRWRRSTSLAPWISKRKP
jgi:hypothetical protein